MDLDCEYPIPSGSNLEIIISSGARPTQLVPNLTTSTDSTPDSDLSNQSHGDIKAKKTVVKACPTVRDRTTDQLSPEGDEYIPRVYDEAGEGKVSLNGRILGGREYRFRTFCVLNRGEKLFALAPACARVLGFRDSFLLFHKNRPLFQIIATQAEKDDLIRQEIIPYSFRSRRIAIVTAKSLFRQFGSRVITNGRRVRDDYWEAEARKQGFTEDDTPGQRAGRMVRKSIDAGDVLKQFDSFLNSQDGDEFRMDDTVTSSSLEAGNHAFGNTAAGEVLDNFDFNSFLSQTQIVEMNNALNSRSSGGVKAYRSDLLPEVSTKRNDSRGSETEDLASQLHSGLKLSHPTAVSSPSSDFQCFRGGPPPPASSRPDTSYQQQLLLLERQNKQLLLRARQEHGGRVEEIAHQAASNPEISYHQQSLPLEQQSKQRLVQAKQGFGGQKGGNRYQAVNDATESYRQCSCGLDSGPSLPGPPMMLNARANQLRTDSNINPCYLSPEQLEISQSLNPPPQGIPGQQAMSSNAAQANHLLMANNINPAYLSPTQLETFQAQPPWVQKASIQIYARSMAHLHRPTLPQNAVLQSWTPQYAPMTQAGMDVVPSTPAHFDWNSAMRIGPHGSMNQNALQDYQMQLLLLEQQNKKRLLMARQEQDKLNLPGGIL